MRILITNDDGIRAPGLSALVDVAKQFGEVKVVAPDRERSACGHSMTMREPLRVSKVAWDGIEAYDVNGCDLVLSGINNGPNLGFDITYSGTVAGAMEGSINGIRSIGLSMALFVSGAPIHYETGALWLRENWDMLVSSPSKPLSFLNVNIPSIEFVEVRGHRITQMGQRVYQDRVEVRQDPWGRPYYWQGGVVVMESNQPGTDVQAVSEGFVSITPVSLDWTDRALMSELQGSMRHVDATPVGRNDARE